MISISSSPRIDLDTLVDRLRTTMPVAIGSFPVQLAYLYGSAARVQTTPLSDVDIALAACLPLPSAQTLQIEMDVQYELSRRVGLERAEVRMIVPLPILLQGQVATAGILLYARAEEAHVDYETSVREAHYDFCQLANAGRKLYMASLLQGHSRINREKVEGLIRRQQQYLRYLRVFAQVDESEFASNPEKTGAAKYYGLVAIETCLDLGNHIISAMNWRAPSDYADLCRVLGEEQVREPE